MRVPLPICWLSGLLQTLGHCKLGFERPCTRFVKTPISILSGTHLGAELRGNSVRLPEEPPNLSLRLEPAASVTGSGPLHMLTQMFAQLGPCLPPRHSRKVTSLERLPDLPGYEGPAHPHLSPAPPSFPSGHMIQLPACGPAQCRLWIKALVHTYCPRHTHTHPAPHGSIQRAQKVRLAGAPRSQGDLSRCGQTGSPPAQLRGGW